MLGRVKEGQMAPLSPEATGLWEQPSQTEINKPEP